ncbi:hypothetical protein MiAbW_03341 [Microcystis aeruginosa NIES-4325]|uniref:Uncharacterized protein n=1 Tax=Microcystis aeruginosa NIES-4325 TaxID=2569534 RepID=A0A5J4FBY7_MICAE|nr:hypothetical protein [Microcystis aeruginosa]MDB9508650.1 hypothetical protein [Microcystis aeruginosa CS-338/01]GEA28762.1 hypothetical protein MiAbW_03341 [Microcystis aeruginosa NIES-4325]
MIVYDIKRILSFTVSHLTFVELYVHLAFFVNEEKQGKHDLMYGVLFGLLLILKNYFIIPQMTAQEPSIIVILSPLLMLILGGLVIKEGLNNQR